MRFIFDIDENGRILTSLIPLADNEKTIDLSRISIEHPIRDTYRLRDEGAYNALSDSQFQILIDRLFSIEPYFNQPISVQSLLEQLIEAFINMEVPS